MTFLLMHPEGSLSSGDVFSGNPPPPRQGAQVQSPGGGGEPVVPGDGITPATTKKPGEGDSPSPAIPGNDAKTSRTPRPNPHNKVTPKVPKHNEHHRNKKIRHTRKRGDQGNGKRHGRRRPGHKRNGKDHGKGGMVAAGAVKGRIVIEGTEGAAAKGTRRRKRQAQAVRV